MNFSNISKYEKMITHRLHILTIFLSIIIPQKASKYRTLSKIFENILNNSYYLNQPHDHQLKNNKHIGKSQNSQ